jgi:hypothetical protein
MLRTASLVRLHDCSSCHYRICAKRIAAATEMMLEKERVLSGTVDELRRLGTGTSPQTGQHAASSNSRDGGVHKQQTADRRTCTTVGSFVRTR